MNCSEWLADFLVRRGVTDVFGFPGGYITPFMDALLDRRGELAVHLCHHEQGCALAACGLARVTGGVGVFFTTSGPGAVNALGGLADAWFDGVPVMGICGNVPTGEMRGFSGIRQVGFQEMDIVSMTRPITKCSVTPASAEQLVEAVPRAWNMATTGRKGGVVVDFPFDVQTAGVAGGERR